MVSLALRSLSVLIALLIFLGLGADARRRAG